MLKAPPRKYPAFPRSRRSKDLEGMVPLVEQPPIQRRYPGSSIVNPTDSVT
jgi:hypothetical protein